jgi:hypothetical protein
VFEELLALVLVDLHGCGLNNVGVAMAGR